MRLGPETLEHMPAAVGRFGYDRDAQAFGIVHFGIGAFHRAHQAWYTDLAMDGGDVDWAICGVSLRSRTVAEQLEPQSGLYTLTQRSGDSRHTRVIGAVREVLFARRQAEEVVARLSDPACHIVSFTVTEKGYARGRGNELDMEAASASFYPLLAKGLAVRSALGLPGLTLLSCDNLAENGRVLADLVAQWLETHAPETVEWFLGECRVPASMIDRIVPRTDPRDLAELQDRIGMTDAGAVFTEKFSQWVIEDSFAGPRPDWGRYGAQIVSDVQPFETAKLRMLNGAHSLLAYCGLRAGHEFVHQAAHDPELRALAMRLMREEALPTIEATEEQDLPEYADQLMRRFSDPALMHRLDQIAMDGTQKIPQRWLDTVALRQQSGLRSPAIYAGFEAWLWHLDDGRWVDDPHGVELTTLSRRRGTEGVLDRCFGSDEAEALWPGHTSLRGEFEGRLDGSKSI